MSAPSTVTATRYIIIAIALVAIAVLIWSVAEVFVIAFGAIVMASVLRAMVVPLARVTHWKERIALLVGRRTNADHTHTAG